jgi:hypothetical protein
MYRPRCTFCGRDKCETTLSRQDTPAVPLQVLGQLYNPLGCCSDAFEAHGRPRRALMELASTGDLSCRSLALRRNAPSEGPLTTRPPCLCQIPSHIIGDVTATFRALVRACLRCSDGSISASFTANLPPSSTSLRADAHLMISSSQQALGMKMGLAVCRTTRTGVFT